MQVFMRQLYATNTFLILRGAFVSEDDGESAKREQIQSELKALSEEEACLDRDTSLVQNSLRKLAEDPKNVECAFVSHEDIRSAPSFVGDTIIAIKAPSGTKLEVPDPDEGMEYPMRRFQIFLKSAGDPIDVYLVSKVEEGSDEENILKGPTEGGDSLETDLSIDTLGKNEPVSGEKNDVFTNLDNVEGSPYKSCDLNSIGGGVVKLSSPPMDDDYFFSLDDTEGISDLYDLPFNTSDIYSHPDVLPSGTDDK